MPGPSRAGQLRQRPQLPLLPGQGASWPRVPDTDQEKHGDLAVQGLREGDDGNRGQDHHLQVTQGHKVTRGIITLKNRAKEDIEELLNNPDNVSIEKYEEYLDKYR